MTREDYLCLPFAAKVEALVAAHKSEPSSVSDQPINIRAAEFFRHTTFAYHRGAICVVEGFGNLCSAVRYLNTLRNVVAGRADQRATVATADLSMGDPGGYVG